MGNKDWKIYILSHNEIYDEYYQNDKYFNYENYEVFNVNTKKDIKIQNADKFHQLSQRKFSNFQILGANYAESEAIWNLWREGLHKNYKYIGFIHYDVDINTPNGENISLTQEIENYIAGKEKAHIAFLYFNPQVEWDKWSDKNLIQPQLSGNKIGYYQHILNDYNEFFHTNYTEEDFKSKSHINLCSCFLIDTKTFDKMMSFFDYAINKGSLSVFDITNDYRLPGGLAERYFGLFMLFEYDETKLLLLNHRGITTNKTYGTNEKYYKRIVINALGFKFKFKLKYKRKKNKLVEIYIGKSLHFAIQDLYKRIVMSINGLLVYDNERSNYKLRNFLYRTLGMKIGKNVFISRGLDLTCAYNVTIENDVDLGQCNTIQAFANVKINRFVHTAREVSIIAGTHDNSTFGGSSKPQDVEIGAGCWIGTRVTILGGVKIGKGCVIGAGSVVNKDIPDFSIAAGVPCKVIKKRIPAKEIVHPSRKYKLEEICTEEELAKLNIDTL